MIEKGMGRVSWSRPVPQEKAQALMDTFQKDLYKVVHTIANEGLYPGDVLATLLECGLTVAHGGTKQLAEMLKAHGVEVENAPDVEKLGGIQAIEAAVAIKNALKSLLRGGVAHPPKHEVVGSRADVEKLVAEAATAGHKMVAVNAVTGEVVGDPGEDCGDPNCEVHSMFRTRGKEAVMFAKAGEKLSPADLLKLLMSLKKPEPKDIN